MFHKQAIDYIIGKMRIELPDTLRYHSIDHTFDVIEAAKRIADSESISKNEWRMLLTAAAFHDSGFTQTYKEHEEASCSLATKYLPQFNYSNEAIRTIRNMILSTRIPQIPNTLLEKILCDADLDYLGRGNYYEIANSLYEEMRLNGIEIDEDQWLDIQIEFLKAHQFWTDFARKHRKKGKEKVLEELMSQQQASS